MVPGRCFLRGREAVFPSLPAATEEGAMLSSRFLQGVGMEQVLFEKVSKREASEKQMKSKRGEPELGWGAAGKQAKGRALVDDWAVKSGRGSFLVKIGKSRRVRCFDGMAGIFTVQINLRQGEEFAIVGQNVHSYCLLTPSSWSC